MEPFKEEDIRDFVNRNAFHPIVLKIAPILRRACITPNIVTIVRMILIVLVLYLVGRSSRCKGLDLILVLGLLFINFLFDDLDGYMARKYKQTSKVGAVLDVIADVGLAFGTLMIMRSKLHWNAWTTIVAGVVFFALFKFLHHLAGGESFFFTNRYVLETIFIVYTLFLH